MKQHSEARGKILGEFLYFEAMQKKHLSPIAIEKKIFCTPKRICNIHVVILRKKRVVFFYLNQCKTEVFLLRFFREHKLAQTFT